MRVNLMKIRSAIFVLLVYGLAICHESYTPPLSDHAIISPEATRRNKASENVVY